MREEWAAGRVGLGPGQEARPPLLEEREVEMAVGLVPCGGVVLAAERLSG